MKKWGTLIYAISPNSNEKTITFCGPTIEAPSRKLAHQYCQENGLGYCHISDELIAEIDSKTGNIVDYEIPQKN